MPGEYSLFTRGEVLPGVSRVASGWRGGTVLAGSALVLLLALLYLWVATGGRWSLEWPAALGGDRYQRLARAFLAGQLALLETPPPELASLPDPYEPRVWARLPVTMDVSYYQGRYYLYFGPLPALVGALLGVLTGDPLPDGVLALGFGLTYLVAAGAALLVLWQRFAPTGPTALLAACFAVLALMSPVPTMLGWPRVYEAAIFGGQAALLGGLALALGAWPHPAGVRVVLAGVALGAAVASRWTLLPAVSALALGLTLLWPQQRLRTLLALGVPLGLSVALLALYNWARFGSPLETGWQYAFAGLPERAWLPIMYHPANMLQTLPTMLLRPPTLVWSPPFLVPAPWSPAEWEAIGGWFAESYGLPGALWTTPLLLASLAALLPWRVAGAAFARWLLVVAALAAAPVLVFRGLNLRYLLDFLPLAMLVATLVLSWLVARARWLLLPVLVLAAWSVAAGLALGLFQANLRGGFSERESILARLARLVPAVQAVSAALNWIGEREPAGTLTLVAAPLPAIAQTVDVGSAPRVEVVAADPATDPCWTSFPGPGVRYLVSPQPVGPVSVQQPATLRLFGWELPAGPTAYVSQVDSAVPPPRALERPSRLCPIAADAGSAPSMGADYFRRWKTRALGYAGWVIWQPVETRSGQLTLAIRAYAQQDDGRAPQLVVELRATPEGPPLALQTVAVTQDYRLATFQVQFTGVPTGPRYPAFRLEGGRPDAVPPQIVWIAWVEASS
ncbi:MAG: hypothetical protein K6U89_11835 [Chloroflexi bacterium]|nr:hypothetical protein [Chloroflexota bacterium]